MTNREKLLAALDAGDKVTVLDLFDKANGSASLVDRLRSGGDEPVPADLMGRNAWLVENWALRLEAADRITELERTE